MKTAAKVIEDDDYRKKLSTGFEKAIDGIDNFLEEEKRKNTTLTKKISSGLVKTIGGIDELLEGEKGKDATIIDATAKDAIVEDTTVNEPTLNDIKSSVDEMRMMVSLCVLAGSADGIINDKEEEAIDNIIDVIGFNGDETNQISPVFKKPVLDKFGIKKKDIKNQLCECFSKPYSLEEVVKDVVSKEMEENAYMFACIIAGSNDNLGESEVEFLLKFAKMLDLPILDRKRIEKEQLGKVLPVA